MEYTDPFEEDHEEEDTTLPQIGITQEDMPEDLLAVLSIWNLVQLAPK